MPANNVASDVESMRPILETCERLNEICYVNTLYPVLFISTDARYWISSHVSGMQFHHAIPTTWSRPYLEGKVPHYSLLMKEFVPNIMEVVYIFWKIR